MDADRSALRPDLRVIAGMIPAGASLLDIGCGEGDLLAWLSEHRQVAGRGLELSQQGVNRCIARGLAVIQGNAETDLSYYPDLSFDYAVLSQTLQAMHEPKAVLRELVRIARHAIVSVPNFGHWKNRLYLLARGRMPVTKTLSYQWYDTPNIHFCTIRDFVALCEELGLTIEKQVYVGSLGEPSAFTGQSRMANLLGEQGVFMVKIRDKA